MDRSSRTVHDPWYDRDPWIDFAIVSVSRDRLVRLAVVQALKSSSEVSLASLPPDIEAHIQEKFGLSGVLAETALALHINNLRRIQGLQYWPGPESANG